VHKLSYDKGYTHTHHISTQTYTYIHVCVCVCVLIPKDFPTQNTENIHQGIFRVSFYVIYLLINNNSLACSSVLSDYYI